MAPRLDLNDLRLLMQVVDHGGYSAASRALGLAKSTISQRIAALEASAGTGLLRRTSRSFSVTDAGRLLLGHARSIDEQAKEAETALLQGGDEPVGTLRVATSVTIAQFAIAPLLPGFFAEFPRVSVTVGAANSYVDLIAGGYDMAVRAHELALDDSTLITRVVAWTPWSLAASPEWVSRCATVSVPEDLIGLDALYFGAVYGEPRWAFSKGGDKRTIRPSPKLRSDDMGMLKHAATESLGCVALPTYVLRDALGAGRLVPLLSDWAMPVAAMSVVTPPRRQSSRLAKTFSDYLAKNLPRLLKPAHPAPVAGT